MLMLPLSPKAKTAIAPPDLHSQREHLQRFYSPRYYSQKLYSSAQYLHAATYFKPKVKKRIVRDLLGLDPCLARSGTLEVRLATTKSEIRKAQKLRFKVFFEEGGAIPDRKASLTRRDICAFDRICDHLLVIDHAAKSKRLGLPKPKVVGTYRLLRQDIAEAHTGFYSASEFEIAPLLARHPGKKFLELGRSCVLSEYRTKHSIDLLWQGIASYLNHHSIDVMIGCASFHGVNPLKIAAPLSFLASQSAANEIWSAKALGKNAIPMNYIAADSLDMKKAVQALPPLIKAYWRIGAMFGQGAVIDPAFRTIDVLVVLPVAQIDARYMQHFGIIAKAA